MINLKETIPEFGTKLDGVDYAERICAYGIITNDQNQVALIGLPQGVYLPGGGVYPNETLINGLKREILEETGYTSTVGEKIGVAAQYRNDSSTGIPYKKVGHYYFVNLRIQIQDAIEKDHQLIWRDANSASLILKREAQRWGLQAGLRMQKKPKLIGKISGRAFIDFTRGKLLGN